MTTIHFEGEGGGMDLSATWFHEKALFEVEAVSEDSCVGK
jgi:hypothetical protein